MKTEEEILTEIARVQGDVEDSNLVGDTSTEAVCYGWQQALKWVLEIKSETKP